MRFLVTLLCLAAASPAAAPFDSAQGKQTLTVLSSNATKALIEELGPQFETASGQQLTIRFDNSAALKTRIEKGETFDIAVLSAPTIAALVTSGKLTAASRADIARAGVGMAIHHQGTKPDISTLDALRGALITARSITYVEQGATAPVMRAIFARLGLLELMNAKTVYPTALRMPSRTRKRSSVSRRSARSSTSLAQHWRLPCLRNFRSTRRSRPRRAPPPRRRRVSSSPSSPRRKRRR